MNHQKRCQGEAFRFKCCNVGSYNVKGYWLPHNQLTSPTKFSYTVNTIKSTKESQSSEWSSSVTSSVSSGFKIIGIGGVSSTLETSTSKTMANQDQKYWSNSYKQAWTSDFGAENVGSVVWQWVYDIKDPFGYQTLSYTNSLALTSWAGQQPECLPGKSRDGNYTNGCLDGYYLPGTAGYNATVTQGVWAPVDTQGEEDGCRRLRGNKL